MRVYNINRETESGLAKFMQLFQPDSWLFVAVEKIWFDWFEHYTQPGAPMGRDIYDMYYSDDAIYSKRGAIEGAIEQIFQVMDEENIPFISLNDRRLDLTCAFE